MGEPAENELKVVSVTELEGLTATARTWRIHVRPCGATVWRAGVRDQPGADCIGIPSNASLDQKVNDSVDAVMLRRSWPAPRALVQTPFVKPDKGGAEHFFREPVGSQRELAPLGEGARFGTAMFPRQTSPPSSAIRPTSC